MKVVDKHIGVMAFFSKEGVPKPLQFSIIEDEEIHKVRRIKVKRIFKITENKKLIIVYPCQGEINNRIIHFELRFYPYDVYWVLYKI